MMDVWNRAAEAGRFDGMPKRETSIFELDADVARRAKDARRRALNVVRIPALRFVGFFFVLLFVLLYNLFVSSSFEWTTYSFYAAATLAYCWLSWVALAQWYDRLGVVDLGVVFLAVDMVLWTVAVYLCGAENSWLLFFLIVRAADQATTSFRRSLFFAHFGVVCYVGLLLYARLVDGHPLNLAGESVKLVVLYGTGVYLCLTAKAAEEIRERTRAAIHLSRDLIAKLRSKEGELVASERRFRDLFENAPVGIYRTSPEGRVLLANPALLRMLGYDSLEELAAIDLEAGSVANSYSRAEFKTRLDRDGEIRGLEAIWTRRDGSNIYVSENTRVERDEDGHVLYYEGTIEDISTRKEAELAMRDARDAAEAAARAKSEFLANMSHEIRTPMNAIIGMTSLLLETDLTPEQREFVETARQGGDALLSIVNDVLDFSKIDAGRLDLERQPFDLRECIEDCLDLVAAQAAGKGLTLVYEVDDATPHSFVGDVTRLRQILANLLSNAVKFTSSGEVSVRVDSREIGSGSTMLRFVVRDTGIGIPDDRVERLFESFTQADASTTRKFGGTGLGLAISKRLAELMGGIMWAQSGPDGGSTFSFTILVGTHDAPAPPHLTDARPELVGRRVLVVSSIASTRRAIAAHIRHWGASATPVASAAEAATQLQAAEPFDAAVVDVATPDLDAAGLGGRPGRPADLADLKIVRLAPRGWRRGEDVDDVDATVTVPVRAAALHAAMLSALTGVEAESMVAPPAEPATESTLRVLVVEDNAINQKVAVRMLARLGVRADVAGDGVEAVEAVERQHYDVVFMDVQMPELDGIAATRRIRETMPPDAQPRIVAMTASVLKGDREACVEAGMDDYVGKPVRLQDLADALARAGSAALDDERAKD
jgi:PAS domain S-box-containing protein